MAAYSTPPGRRAAAGALLAIVAAGALLAGCKDDGGAPPTLTLDQARQATATFSDRTRVAPPRSIEDITAILDQQGRDDLSMAKRDVERADARPPSDADRSALALFYIERGTAARRLGRTNQALADLTRAHELGTELNSNRKHAILGNLFGLESQVGRSTDAVRHIREAIATAGKTHPPRVISLLTLLARRQAHWGDLQAAERTLAGAEERAYMLKNGVSRRARKAWIKAGQAIQSQLDRARASILDIKGKYIEAERYHRAAIVRRESGAKEFSSTSGNRDQGRESMHGALANNLLAQGRLVESEIEYREMLLSALRRTGRYGPNVAWAAIGLTSVLNAQGRDRDAEALARAAIEILQRTGAVGGSRAFLKARGQLAQALIAQSRWMDALSQFDIMQAALAGDDQARKRRFGGNTIYALTLLMNGRKRQAREVARRAVGKLRTRMGAKHRQTALARGILAMTLRASGEHDKALAEFAQSVPYLTQRSRRSDDDQRTVRRRQLKWIIESYMEALAQAPEGASGTSAEAAARAFRLADFLRGRSVQAALAASAARAAARDPDLAELARREQDSLSQIGALNGLLVNAVSVPIDHQNGKAIEALRGRIDTLRGARAALAKEIERRFPDYAALVNPRPGTLAEARAVLRPGEALISTYVGENRTFVWALQRAGAAAFAAVPMGRGKIADMVARLRLALEPQAATLGDIPDFDVKLSHLLYRTVLGPVERGWKRSKSLLIVAHGALAQIPFSVLVTRRGKPSPTAKPLFAGYRRTAWLARSHAVTLLPSVASLATLRRLPPPRPGRRAFVGFGDPLFNADQAAAADDRSVPSGQVFASRGALALRGVPVTLRAAPAVADLASADLSSLPRLPETATEILSIAAALDADPRTDVFLRRRATEATVKTMRLDRVRVLVFATHGLVPGDLDGLTQPALALTSPEVSGTPGDGLLTMGEILGLRLDADWVVLSACNTAAASGAGAEAVSGLGRAFFYAGTRALLVSNWPVETTSAKELTTELFRRQVGAGSLTRAEALRRSMIELIDDKGYRDQQGRMVFSYAHPIFWAPFSLIGDGGR